MLEVDGGRHLVAVLIHRRLRQRVGLLLFISRLCGRGAQVRENTAELGRRLVLRPRRRQRIDFDPALQEVGGGHLLPHQRAAEGLAAVQRGKRQRVHSEH